MIRIGNCFFDRSAVMAILPQDDGETVSVCVKWGRIFRVKIQPGEDLGRILDGYGLLDPAREPVEPGGMLTAEETFELSSALVEGFEYVAKDMDGRCYAFPVPPEKRGAYWEMPVGFSLEPLRLLGSYECIDPDEDKPVKIAQLLGDIVEVVE